jgi:hypothetical protein
LWSFEEVFLSPSNTTERVVIAVDPHKASWTAVAVDSQLRPLGAVRVEVNRDGYRKLQRVRATLAAGELGG